MKLESEPPHVDLANAIEFTKDVLSVFLGAAEIEQFLSSVSVKYFGAGSTVPSNQSINIFQLFLDVSDTLEQQSKNSQLSTLLKCLADIVGSCVE